MSAPEQVLAAIDAAIAREPGRVELRYHRAAALAGLGQVEDAKAEYLAVIAREPRHFGALNDLATLLYATDYRSAARLAYAEAVRHHPENPVGRINLANALLAEGIAEEARTHFEAALGVAPEHPDAHQGLANLHQEAGDFARAEAHRRRSYAARAVTHLPYRGAGPPRRVLVLVSAVGGNISTRFLFDDRRFAVAIQVVEASAPEVGLPPHDLVFNAIGDADLCAPALDAAQPLLTNTTARVINAPAKVRRTGRAATASALAGLPGVRAARVALAKRSGLELAAREFEAPFLVRSPGYHTGQHFLKVEAHHALAAAAAQLPGDELLLIAFTDARDAQGWFCKYRAMAIGGEWFPLHLAMSRDWKVHYFTAAMADHPDHRRREQAFLEDMPRAIGSVAADALAAIGRTLGLDYMGVDFGLSQAGELLVFEANATMVVNPPGPEPIWDYRRPAVDRILAAVESLAMSKPPQPVRGCAPPIRR